MVIQFLSIFMKAIEQSSMNWTMPHAASLSHWYMYQKQSTLAQH